jgi:hypothetical protein
MIPGGFLSRDKFGSGYVYPKDISLTLPELRQRLIEDLPFVPSYPSVSYITAYLAKDQKDIKELKSEKINLVGHEEKIKAMAYLAVNWDDCVLVSVSDKIARIWNIEKNSCQAVLKDHYFASTPPVSLYNDHSNHIAFLSSAFSDS